MDHFHQIQFVGRPEEPMLEGWTVISMLAGLTTKIKLGTLVTGIIYIIVKANNHNIQLIWQWKYEV